MYNRSPTGTRKAQPTPSGNSYPTSSVPCKLLVKINRIPAGTRTPCLDRFKWN